MNDNHKKPSNKPVKPENFKKDFVPIMPNQPLRPVKRTIKSAVPDYCKTPKVRHTTY